MNLFAICDKDKEEYEHGDYLFVSIIQAKNKKQALKIQKARFEILAKKELEEQPNLLEIFQTWPERAMKGLKAVKLKRSNKPSIIFSIGE